MFAKKNLTKSLNVSKQKTSRYGSEPYDAEKKKINHNYGDKDVDFRDEMECLLETLSVEYEITY